VLGEAGIAKDSGAGREGLDRQMEIRRGAEEDAGYKVIRWGWFFGSKVLKWELLG